VTVVTFENYRPSARFDGVKWTNAMIEEAPASAGPWTLIDTQPLSPLDTDASDPQARNFTTDNATLAYGWYRITFTDSLGATGQPTVPQYNGTMLAYEPTVDQVARKILSRTRDKYGNVIGSFTPDTLPTDSQAQAITSDVITEVADVVGDVVPDFLINDASNVVAIRAAMQIELDFFPDQVNTSRSIYDQLKAEYESALAALQSAVSSAEAGDTSVVDTNPATRASYSFPQANNWYEGRW
jgi:hypothetical protein